MPDGKYAVTLSQTAPKLTQPRDENDYFSKEQVELWGVDGFWGMPHFPKTEYYRLSSSKLNKEAGFFEFLIPTFPLNMKQLGIQNVLWPQALCSATFASIFSPSP